MRSATASPHLHRAAVALGVAVASLAFTACADNPEPRATKSATSSASTKPTPSSKPSKTPSTAPSGPLDEQLQSAAQTFYDTLNTSYKTLDTAPFKAISPANCEACGRYVAAINTTKSEGHRYADIGEYLIADFKIVKNFSKDNNKASGTYQLTYTGFKEVDASGKAVRTEARQTWPTQAIFHKDGDKWIMAEELGLE